MTLIDKLVTTPFGQVSFGHDLVTIVATAAETAAWANRPGSRWPCSTLAGHPVEAAFIRGDLVDFEGPEDVDGVEFDAFAADLRALAEEGPA